VYVFPAGTTDFALTHQYLDDNPSGTISDNYTINLTVSDDDSGSNPGSTSVTVNNVAPVITSTDNSASSQEKAEEGEPVIISGAFTDVGTLDTHEVTYDWGDGTIEPATLNQGSGSGTFTADHAYAAGGIFTVTITVTDDDTQSDTAVETVFITGAGVQTIDGKQVLFIVGTNEADRVHVIQQGNGNVVVQANFLPRGRRTFFEPIDEIRMYLCAGDDRGTVAASVQIPALLDGGLGNDELNAAGASAVLLGGAGIDTLVGSGANDLLIGGTGQDRLVGNGLEDILIGGDTSYDFTEDDDVLAQQAALLSILAEWNSDRSLEDRQANINGTGIGPRLNDDNFLTHLVTVFDDGEIDKLTGSGGIDWFFVFANDDATDFHQSTELLN
jgi:Ca2+-binding RTX toxin-like protein